MSDKELIILKHQEIEMKYQGDLITIEEAFAQVHNFALDMVHDLGIADNESTANIKI